MKSHVLIIGEEHFAPEHHEEELEIIQGLYNKGDLICVAIEFVEIKNQKYLDDYLSGKLPEKRFEKLWDKWWWEFSYYKNILNFCKDNQIPMLAADDRSNKYKKERKECHDVFMAISKEHQTKAEKMGMSYLLSDESKKLLAKRREITAKINELIELNIDYKNNFISNVIQDYLKGKGGTLILLIGAIHGSPIESNLKKMNIHVEFKKLKITTERREELIKKTVESRKSVVV